MPCVLLPKFPLSVQARLEPGLDVRPGALILVFLLSPEEFGVGILLALLLDQVVWEGRDLFHPHEDDLVVQLFLTASFTEVVEHFSSTEDYLLYATGVLRRGAIIRDNSKIKQNTLLYLIYKYY